MWELVGEFPHTQPPTKNLLANSHIHSPLQRHELMKGPFYATRYATLPRFDIIIYSEVLAGVYIHKTSEHWPHAGCRT